MVTSLPVRSTTAARWTAAASDNAGIVVDLALLPVPPLGLEEDDRVVGRDRLLNHAVAVAALLGVTTRSPAVWAK